MFVHSGFTLSNNSAIRHCHYITKYFQYETIKNTFSMRHARQSFFFLFYSICSSSVLDIEILPL